VALDPDGAVLDVACGTGIVARCVRERLGTGPRVAGIDLNHGMIEMARALDAGIEWHVADAARLPFANGEFAAAFCQQGIQFFPDAPAALGEIRRVLRANGRLALTLWREASDFFLALVAALERHVSAEVAQKALSPFGHLEGGALDTLLAEAGFEDVSEQVFSIDRIIRDPETSNPKEIMGNPVGPDVAACGGQVMEAITREMIDALPHCRQGGDLIIPQAVRLVQTVSP
jgi:ubiquinone/menaquinone biosynthesis C-methylase UbiE